MPLLAIGRFKPVGMGISTSQLAAEVSSNVSFAEPFASIACHLEENRKRRRSGQGQYHLRAGPLHLHFGLSYSKTLLFIDSRCRKQTSRLLQPIPRG